MRPRLTLHWVGECSRGRPRDVGPAEIGRKPCCTQATIFMNARLRRVTVHAIPENDKARECGPCWIGGAEGGTRTHTLLRAADFESAASTDSATSACCQATRRAV